MLSQQRFYPVGANNPVHVDVRVIAATNKNLEDEIARGNFREDLFYRLNVIPFFVPPLRDRKEDIPSLVREFLSEFGQQYGRPRVEISDSALTQLRSYNWPGNVRELRNVIERVLILNPKATRIEVKHLPVLVQRTDGARNCDKDREEFSTLHQAREAYERDYILKELDRTHGNITRAAESLGLVRSLKGDRYGLADLGAALIGNPGIAGMVEHHALLYADLADPVRLLRGQAQPTRLSGYWPYASGTAAEPEAYARYSALMGASQAMIAGDILDACDLSSTQSLMDVGGGEGVFLEAVAARHPQLDLTLLDLPAVATRATARLSRLGLGDRITCRGGDFHAGLPSGADAISLVRIVHDHDDGPAQALLAAAHGALPPGGRLILAEPMAGTPGAEPVGDAYFGLYLLAMGSGRPRRSEELRTMLREAGFASVQEPKTRRPLLARVLIAQKSGAN